MFKKAASGFSQTILLFALFIAVFSATVFTLFTPLHIKNWLSGGRIYTAAPSVITENITKNESKNDQTSSLLTNPLIKQAVLETITPKLLSTTADSLIDNGFGWLDGTSKELRLTIPIDQIRKDFADNLHDLIHERYESLPPCTPQLQPSTTDPLTINCRAGNVLPGHEELEAYIDQTIDSSGIFNAETIKDGSVVLAENSNTTLPKIYQYTKLIPIIASLLVVLGGVGVVLTSDKRKLGLAKLGRLLAAAGLLIASLLWLSSIALIQAEDSIYDHITNLAARDAIHATLTTIKSDLLRTGLVFALIPIVFGLVLVTIMYVDKKIHEPRKPKPVPEPVPEPEPIPEPAPEVKPIKAPVAKTAPIVKQPPKPKLVKIKDENIVKPTQEAEFK